MKIKAANLQGRILGQPQAELELDLVALARRRLEVTCPMDPQRFGIFAPTYRRIAVRCPYLRIWGAVGGNEYRRETTMRR